MGKLNKTSSRPEKGKNEGEPLSEKAIEKPPKKQAEKPKGESAEKSKGESAEKQSKNNIVQLAVDNSKKTIKKPNSQGKDQNQAKNDQEKKGKDEKNPQISEEMAREIEYREKEVSRIFRENRNKGGRPTKLDENMLKNLEVLARIGLSEKAMAESVMVSPAALNRWLKKKPEVYKRIKEARNQGKSVLVNSVFGHGLKSWQASAWLLERCYRSEFALDKQKIELTGKEGGPLTFIVKYEDKPASEASIKTK